MDIRHQCLCCSKTQSYIGTHITHLYQDHQERIVYISAEQLPDDGYAFKHDIILLQLVHEPHCEVFFNLPKNIQAIQTPATKMCLSINSNILLGHRFMVLHTWTTAEPASLLIKNIWRSSMMKIYLWLTLPCEEEYWLVHSCINHNLSRAVINELFRNPTIAIIRIFTVFHTSLNWLNEMSYAKRFESWKSGKVCISYLADANNLRDDDYTRCFSRNPVECIELLMQQPVFREHMLYAPAKEFNNAEEHIYSEVKSHDWLWNEQVHFLYCMIATMISTTSIATAAAWSYDCHLIWQLRPDTSYKLSRWQEGMSSMSET